jgi:hypothetical protein
MYSYEKLLYTIYLAADMVQRYTIDWRARADTVIWLWQEVRVRMIELCFLQLKQVKNVKQDYQLKHITCINDCSQIISCVS